MIEQLHQFLLQNIAQPFGPVPYFAAVALALTLTSVAAYWVARLLEIGVMYFVEKSTTNWDNDLLDSKFLRALCQLVPALIVYLLLPRFFKPDGTAVHWVNAICKIYILWTCIFILATFTDNVYNAFSRRPSFRPYAVKGIFQMIRLICIGIGIILTISIFIDRSPASILISLGASAAVLMLVFKDTILGLVASVQLTANNMLQRGDWVVVDSHNANGEVLDISLTTVKILNWDNSVTTVPPYCLVSESFRNYQHMRDADARRVDRSIYIDINTVRFCTPDEVERLRSLHLLDGLNIDDPARVVNLRLLRDYLDNYLANHQAVRADLLHMVRQMDPTPSGLPLQLYFFTSDTNWKLYERTQSEIFDHLYAVVREFGLSIFQTPAGSDIIIANRNTSRHG